MNILKIEEEGETGDTIELEVGYDGNPYIEIDNPFSGDTDSGIGRRATFTMTKKQARALGEALLKIAGEGHETQTNELPGAILNVATNRDWKNVDWHWETSSFGQTITVSATDNGTEIRSYGFNAGIPFKAARLIDDMLAALRQHRGQT